MNVLVIDKYRQEFYVRLSGLENKCKEINETISHLQEIRDGYEREKEEIKEIDDILWAHRLKEDGEKK